MSSPVSLVNVGKDFGDKPIVKDISLDIQPGEFVVLVGPSGCGKSTTLRMIAGLESLTRGEIRIDDKVVNNLAPKERGVAMVFQNYALYPHLTVRDNMAFGLLLAKQPKSAIDTAIAGAARMLGLESLLERRPAELSGGQRQRVAMGRAIVRQPKVFLFDEPLSNLDAKLRNSMRAEIKQLHQKLSNTVVYVTHDQIEAMTLADRIVVMNEGKIEQSGSPEDLYDRPANVFVAAFMGSPPMNLIKTRVTSAAGALSVLGGPEQHILSGRSLPVDKQITFGIRPEHLVLNERVDTGCGQISGVVELVEALGGESLIHLRAGDSPLLARLPGRVALQHGQTADFGFDLTKARLFDTLSGEVVP